MKKKENAEELVDVDESGTPLTKAPEEEAPKNKFHGIIIISLICVVIILGIVYIYNRYVFCQKMSNRILHKVKNVDDIYSQAGELIIEMVKKNPKLRIGLASGGTPKGLYAYLIEQYEKGRVSFREATFYSLDEFCGLPKSHTQSYDHYMRRFFLYRVNAKEDNVFLLNGEGELNDDVSKFEKYAEDYNKLLAENPVDVQILSFGGNGHFGFNEKGTPFDTLTHVVKLDDNLRKEKSKLFDNDLEKTPHYAITQGIQSVLNAKEVIIIANGKGKAQGIKSLIDGEPTTDSPLSALINHKGKVHTFADEEACSLLENLK